MGLDLPSVSSGRRSRTGSSMAQLVGWRILLLYGLMATSPFGWTPHHPNGRLRRVLLGGSHSHTLILSPHTYVRYATTVVSLLCTCLFSVVDTQCLARGKNTIIVLNDHIIVANSFYVFTFEGSRLIKPYSLDRSN